MKFLQNKVSTPGMTTFFFSCQIHLVGIIHMIVVKQEFSSDELRQSRILGEEIDQ